MQLVLEQHDKFADWTINTTLAGLALQIIYLVMLVYQADACGLLRITSTGHILC